MKPDEDRLGKNLARFQPSEVNGFVVCDKAYGDYGLDLDEDTVISALNSFDNSRRRWEKQLAALYEYMDHLPGCETGSNKSPRCTCGLNNILQS